VCDAPAASSAYCSPAHKVWPNVGGHVTASACRPPALPPPSCCLRAAAAACSPMRRSPPRPRPRRAPREEAPSTSLPPGSCRRRAAPWRRRWSPGSRQLSSPPERGETAPTPERLPHLASSAGLRLQHTAHRRRPAPDRGAQQRVASPRIHRTRQRVVLLKLLPDHHCAGGVSEHPPAVDACSRRRQ